ncbi:MAG: DNA-binding response regulator [Gammaproteobacteria bacterium]|nr:MAG: DNA-binding response regulator [Gammaproteobacteria bacterium]RLA54881.1 MAG: DNA-binding response regulator [Gammaproteobacteria bacterium]
MNILIVDDEPLARERLARMVLLQEGVRVVGQASNGQEAIRLAEKHQPDLVFMDVRMPGMDGLAAAQHLAELEPPPAVVFCTAYGDYAVEAFSSQATGYLLKPVKQADLEQALNHSRRVNKAQLTELQQHPDLSSGGRTHIAAKTRGGVDLISVGNIRLFQADHKYVTAYYGDGEALLDETLKDLEEEFDGRFVRVHRNALVSIGHIKGLVKDLDGQYFVRLNGLDITPQVSRRHATTVRKLIEQL